MTSFLVLEQMLSEKYSMSVIYISSILREEGKNILHVPFFSRKFGLCTERQKKEAIEEIKQFIEKTFVTQNNETKTLISLVIADNDSLEVIEKVFLTL